jgi:hypothetical protein
VSYRKLFKETLVHAISSETSGYFRRVMLELLACDEFDPEKDAKALRKVLQ